MATELAFESMQLPEIHSMGRPPPMRYFRTGRMVAACCWRGGRDDTTRTLSRHATGEDAAAKITSIQGCSMKFHGLKYLKFQRISRGCEIIEKYEIYFKGLEYTIPALSYINCLKFNIIFSP